MLHARTCLCPNMVQCIFIRADMRAETNRNVHKDTHTQTQKSTWHRHRHIARGPELQEVILRWIVLGVIIAVHMGPPCQSYSRARRGRRSKHCSRGWPQALRSRSALWGIDRARLTPSDCRTLDIGNRCFSFCLRVLKVCAEQMVPCSLEQPETSLMWSVPELILLADPASPDEAGPSFPAQIVPTCEVWVSRF